MRWCSLALALALLAVAAAGQTTTTVTGAIKDLTGAVVTSGQVTFDLRPGIDTTISGSARFVPLSITCGINGSGQLVSAAGSGSCVVTQNTALTPGGTYYLVTEWPNFVAGPQFNWYAIGTSQDISSTVPTPATAPAYTFADLASNQTIGGNKTFSGQTSAASLEGVLYADQYCAAATVHDQTCINNAETAAAAAGTSVFIPPMTFTAAAQVIILAPTYGAGQGSSVIREASGADLPAPFLIDADGVTVARLTFDCNAAGNTGPGQNGGCLSAESRSQLTIRNTTVQHWYGLTGSTAPCIAIGGSGANINVTDDLVQNCGGSGHAADGIYASGSHIHEVRNTIIGATDTGAVCEAFTDCTIAHNHFINDTQAYGFSGLVTSVPSSNGIGADNVIDGGGPALNGGMVVALAAAPGSLSGVSFAHDIVNSAASTRGYFVERAENVTITSPIITGMTGTAEQTIIIQESRNVTVSGGVDSANVGTMEIAGCTDCAINGITKTAGTSEFGITLGPSPVAIPITALAHAGNVCTATIAAGIPLNAGDFITVSGATGDAGCDGTYPLTSATSTTLAYSVSGSGAPGGSPSLVMECLRCSIRSTEVHNAQDGIVIAGAPQLANVSNNDLLNNSNQAFVDETTGGSYTYRDNVDRAAGSTTSSGSAVMTGQTPLLLANGSFVEWLDAGGTTCAVSGVTNDNPSIVRMRACDDAAGFQWTNQAAGTSWLSLTSSGLSLDSGATLPSGKTLNLSGGSLTQPSAYTAGSATVTNPTSTGKIAVTSQLAGYGSVTTTSATSDAVTIAWTDGASRTPGHCAATPTNSSAIAAAQAGITAKASNQVTLTHAATSGMMYDIVCSPN